MANPTDSLPYPEKTRSREENFLGAIAGLNEIPDYPVKTLSRKENYLKYIAEHGGGGGEGEVKSVNGKTGVVVLKADDIEVKNTLSIQDNLERIDEELGRLEDEKQGLLTAGSNISIVNNVISATGGGAPSAADLDEVIDGTGDITVDLNQANDTLLIGTHAKTVEITGVPATATSGTLTEEQLAALLESDKSVLKFNNEIYFLNDNGHEAGTRGYSHSGVENSVFMLKNITVTLNTRGWVLTTQEVSGGGSGPTVVQTTGTSTTDVMSQNAVTSMVFADPETKRRVQIGSSASVPAANNGGVAISSATVTAAGGIGIANGWNSNTVTGMGAIQIGSGVVNANGAISIGAFTPTNNTVGKFEIGSDSTSYGYNSTNYRLLTGLHDPVNDHDAATKGYVDSHSGGGGDVSFTDLFADGSTQTKIKIGLGASARGSSSVAIGYGANTGNDSTESVAIGRSAESKQQGQIAIGRGSSCSDVTNSIAIGEHSKAPGSSGVSIGSRAGSSITSDYAGSICLGTYSGSNITAAGMMDIGTSWTGGGYNSTNYRLLTGVHDGVNAHDALTVGQANALIDAINAAMNTSIPHIGNAS